MDGDATFKCKPVTGDVRSFVLICNSQPSDSVLDILSALVLSLFVEVFVPCHPKMTTVLSMAASSAGTAQLLKVSHLLI